MYELLGELRESWHCKTVVWENSTRFEDKITAKPFVVDWPLSSIVSYWGAWFLLPPSESSALSYCRRQNTGIDWPIVWRDYRWCWGLTAGYCPTIKMIWHVLEKDLKRKLRKNLIDWNMQTLEGPIEENSTSRRSIWLEDYQFCFFLNLVPWLLLRKKLIYWISSLHLKELLWLLHSQ